MAIHPSSAKSSFGGHFILWAMFLPLLSIIALPILEPDQNIKEAEVQMAKSLNVDVDKVTAATNNVYSAAFIETGILPATENFFGGSVAGLAASKGAIAAKWIRGVWLQVYKAVWRVHVLFYAFLIPLLVLCVAAAVDGFAVRARKRYRFENYNPIFFYSSMHAVVFIVGLFVFLPLAPITLSVGILAAMLACLTFAVWITTSNFQTGS